jgi:hypothetical protein
MHNARKLRLFAVLAALVMVIASFGSAFAQAKSITINLAAQNNSGQSGTATLTDIGGGKTRVEVKISAGAAGVAQPNHIHVGTCDNLTPAPLYPLTNMQNGVSTTEVNATLDSLLASKFAINVHKSGAEASVYVSCGNIVAAANAPAVPAAGAGGATANADNTGMIALVVGLTVVMGASLVVLRRRTTRQ